MTNARPPASRPGQRPFAVFDIDGTLIRWQLYHAVVNELAKNDLMGSGAYEKLQDARMVWKMRTHPEAFREYERQVVSLFDEAVANIRVDKFQHAALRVVEEYKDQVYTYTRDLIRDLQKQNYVLLAISGSQHVLVQALADYYGFDEAVGSVYSQIDHKFTGEKLIASENKGKLLKEMVKKHKLSYANSYAVGDSLSDAPLLELAENPIAFNPDKQLFDLARKKSWNIVIERKNVVYALQSEGKEKYYLL